MSGKAVILCLLFLIPVIPLSSEESILVVTEEWAPFIYESDGELQGVDYEIMDSLFRSLGWDYELRFLPWSRCLLMIENGDADAILDISYTEERAQQMIFPREPISYSESVLFHKRDRAFSIDRLEDLSEYVIGTIRGYAYGEEFRKADYLNLEPVRSLELNIQKLLVNRIDFFISNRPVGLHKIREMGVEDQIDYLDLVISGGENYLAFSISDKNRKLADDFSREMLLFRETEEFSMILDRYNK